MKNLALISIFFCYCSSYGQDIEDIKKTWYCLCKVQKSTNQTKEGGGLSFYTIRLGEVLGENIFIFHQTWRKAIDQIKKYLSRTENHFSRSIKRHCCIFWKYGIIKYNMELFQQIVSFILLRRAKKRQKLQSSDD
jgi:hypothetical protein